MSLKDKIAIGLIVVILIIFAFTLNGMAATPTDTVNVSGVSDLEDLARIAANTGISNQDKFFNISVSELKGKYIIQGDSPTEYQKVIGYRSGLCISKATSSSWSAGDYYQILNVIDFEYDDGEFIIKNNRYNNIK